MRGEQRYGLPTVFLQSSSALSRMLLLTPPQGSCFAAIQGGGGTGGPADQRHRHPQRHR